MYEHLAKMAEEIGAQIHSECPDPQEDASEETGEKIAEAIRAAEPKWTTEPPTAPGWYWVNFDRGAPKIVHILFDFQGKPFDADTIRYGTGINLPAVTHWLGPLPVPEPPKE